MSNDAASRTRHSDAPSRTQDEDVAPKDLTPKLIIAAAVSAISALLYGYDTGIISGALLQIRKDLHTSSAIEQVIAGSILLGAVIGALTCSRLSERRGRRGTVLLLAGVFVAGALLCSIAPNAWLLSGARIILGFAVGGATQTVPMYVAELAPPVRRGQLVLTFQVGIGVGIVVSTIVGATESFTWRISVAMAAVPAAIMFVMLLRLPESPRWLIKAGRDDDARDVLASIRPDGADLDTELNSIREIEEAEQSERDEDRGFLGLKKKWVHPALLVGCGIAVFTQLSGIEMIIYYAPTILTDNGFSKHDALLVSVALGATYLVMMIVGLSIVDHVGRRRLTLIMVPGAAVALFVLGALFVSGHHNRSDIPFVVVCLIVFMFFNAGGLQLMGWLTGSEIYPLAVRSAGTSVQAATLWSTNLLITLTLLTIINAVGAGPTMWLYGLFNVAAWFFVRWRMPELTGRSLEQIETSLRHGDFKPKDFARATAEDGAAAAA